MRTTRGGLAKRLADLEDKTEAPAMNHDTFSRNARNQFKQIFRTLRELMTPHDPPKRPIGYISHEDKGKKTSSQARSKTRPCSTWAMPPNPATDLSPNLPNQ